MSNTAENTRLTRNAFHHLLNSNHAGCGTEFDGETIHMTFDFRNADRKRFDSEMNVTVSMNGTVTVAFCETGEFNKYESLTDSLGLISWGISDFSDTRGGDELTALRAEIAKRFAAYVETFKAA